MAKSAIKINFPGIKAKIIKAAEEKLLKEKGLKVDLVSLLKEDRPTKN
ncbi:hypothetical protein OMO38_10210 [Chryseobacterium sp. 09-1422]|uniref:Uncharacterized protein n=1 Tax=Chryseobacterium kimseyorum TaxID=2984028 RepID=A0ABT3HYR9_9FLAO|nr:hypothetical protein [Chryseobacterium kimseyorum]MCW3168894.1 hypothetical protein [Chryseobacterium kimseyorum]